SRVGEFRLPLPVSGEARCGVHRGQPIGRHVGREPGPYLVAERCRFGVDVEIHQLVLPPESRMDCADCPANESDAVSPLCACAKWCRPKTESIPLRMPIWSSAWLTAFLVRASPKRGISAIFPASSVVLSVSSSRATTRLSMPHSLACCALKRSPVN